LSISNQINGTIRERALTVNAGQLTSKCLNLLTSLCTKYDDLKNVSKIHQIHASIEEVKISMQENVRTALENSVSLETVQSQTGFRHTHITAIFTTFFLN